MHIEKRVVGPLETNCYLVSASEDAPLAVIDPGDQLPVILDAIGERKVAAIVVTHRHFDHVGALPGLVEATGAPVLAGELDAEAVCDPAQNMSDTMGIPSAADKIDVTLGDGDRIRVKPDGSVEVVRECNCGIQGGSEELILDIMHTPGHTIGSIVLVGDGLCFTGDTLFADGSFGRYDLPTGSFENIRDSITKRLFALPDSTRLYPGHGPETTLAREKELSPFR